MKKLNIKKLAAIVTGAALVGTAAAPLAFAAFTDLTKADVVNASGSPVVSIVAGVNADVSDFVWAGNIAAKVAQLSTRTATVTQGTGDGGDLTDVLVDLTVGGTTTIAGAKEFKDSYLTSVVGSTTSGRYEFGRSTTVQGVTLTGRPIQLSKSQIPSLYEATDTVRYNGTDSTISVKEYIGLNADAKMDYTNYTSIGDLALFINAENDFNYFVDLGTGIYRYETTAGTTNFQDDTNDNQRVPLFGKRYVVQNVANTSTSAINYVRLIEDKSKQTFAVGDSFTVVGKSNYAWAGQTLTAKMTQVGQSSSGGNYTARFTLYDADGTEIDTQSVTRKNYIQFQDDQGNYIVQDSIYFDDILVSNTQDLSTATVDLFVGAASLDLYDGKGYPYDASNTNGPWDWKVTLTEGTGTAGGSTDANKLLSIAIGNSRKVWDSTNPIYPTAVGQSLKGRTGAVVELLSGTDDPNAGFATVEFKGWEERESTTQAVIGGNLLQYKDTSGTTHNIPFYINLSVSASGNSFSFDTKTVYYQSNTGDANFVVGNDNNTLNGVAVSFDTNSLVIDNGRAGHIADMNLGGNAVTKPVDINRVTYTCSSTTTRANGINCVADGNVTFAKASILTATSGDYVGNISSSINKTWYYDDGNTTKGDENRAFKANPVRLEGANSQNFDYALYVNETYSPAIWLLLDDQTLATEYSKNIDFQGTDTAEFGAFTAATDPTYYYPDVLDIGGTPSDQTWYHASFRVDENNSTADYTSFVYIDTATHKTPTYPNANLSQYASDVNFNGAWESGASLYLRNDSPYMQATYTDWGSKFTLANGVVTMVMPQNRRYLHLVVSGLSSTSEVSGGDPLTGLAIGDVGTTPGGTRVTVTNVTGTCSGSGACSPSEYQMIVPVGNLVYTDQTRPAGQVVIVGGYLVNSLARNLTLTDGSTLEDALTQSGDMVAEQLPSGDLVVAGYTAADTGRAAQDLINALDDLVG